jgi:hypothetical protein
MKKGKFIAIIVAALIATRLFTLLHPFADVDEALFAVFAKIWLNGGIPYVNAVETKALGIYCYYILASWLSGHFHDISMVGVHAVTIIWTGLTAWVIGRIAARLSNERAGLWAALLFVLMSSFYVPKIVAASMNVILLLPMCLVMDLLLRPAEEIKPWMSFLAGILVATATLIKYQAGIMVFVVLGYFCVLRFSWRPALRHSLWFVLGGLPLPALMLAYLHHVGALADFWYWNFGGSMRYIQTGSASVDLWRKIESHVFTYLACTFPVWILAGMRLVTWLRQGRIAWRQNPLEAGMWIWFFLCTIPVCLGKRFYGHYFLIILPQLCILSAVQIVSWDAAAWGKRRKWLVGGLFFLLMISLPSKFWQRPFYEPIHEEVIHDYKPYGDYLKDRTQPMDRIVVWGFSPAVYWYADRLPASRFLWSDVLVGRMPGLQRELEATIDFTQYERPELWDMFYGDLAKTPPAYIIDMAPTGMHNYQNFPMSKYPELMAYVHARYVVEPDFRDAKIFRRKDLPAVPSRIP